MPNTPLLAPPIPHAPTRPLPPAPSLTPPPPPGEPRFIPSIVLLNKPKFAIALHVRRSIRVDENRRPQSIHGSSLYLEESSPTHGNTCLRGREMAQGKSGHGLTQSISISSPYPNPHPQIITLKPINHHFPRHNITPPPSRPLSPLKSSKLFHSQVPENSHAFSFSHNRQTRHAVHSTKKPFAVHSQSKNMQISSCP